MRFKILNSMSTKLCNHRIRMLGHFWAVNKCKFFLHGAKHFTVITDHKPLIGIFNNHINDLDNPL